MIVIVFDPANAFRSDDHHCFSLHPQTTYYKYPLVKLNSARPFNPVHSGYDIQKFSISSRNLLILCNMKAVSVFVLFAVLFLSAECRSLKPSSSTRFSWCWKIPNGTPKKPLGANCHCNNECLSSRCQDGKCRCGKDSDCPLNYKCFKPLFKPNFCSPTTLPYGAICTKNEQCASDKCQGGKCTCGKDSDCPFGQKCFIRIFSPNYCAPTMKDLGAYCTKNAECKSGKCERNECVCSKDSDCPVGKKCKKPWFKKNYCK